jgi:hypothetical protein
MTTTTSRETSPSFPPVNDLISFVKNIDWENVGHRTRDGMGALLLFAMKLSEWSYEFHNDIYDRHFSCTKTSTDVEQKL